MPSLYNVKYQYTIYRKSRKNSIAQTANPVTIVASARLMMVAAVMDAAEATLAAAASAAARGSQYSGG